MDYDKDTPFGLRGDDDDKPKEECAIFGYSPPAPSSQRQHQIILFLFLNHQIFK
jgi:hypothetical protein